MSIKKKECVIVVYGSSTTESSTIIEQYLQTTLEEQHPTNKIYSYAKNIVMNDNYFTVMINHIDEGCEDELALPILSKSNAILFVFDTTKLETLQHVTEKKNNYLSNIQFNNHIHTLLVGVNYEKFEGDKSLFEKEIKEWQEQNDQMKYISVSLSDTLQITSIFNDICEMIETIPVIKPQPQIIEPSEDYQQLTRREIKRQDYAKFFQRSTQNKKVFVDQHGVGHFNSKEWEPPCELLDCKTHYLLKFEVPGIDKKSINLQYNNNWVILSGNKELPTDGDFRFTEIFYGKFRREVPVPMDVTQTGISASYSDGILYVKLMKITNTTWINVEIQ